MPPENAVIVAALIGAGSGILGLAMGTLVSYWIAKRQFNATVLSGNRQQWINTLRDCLAEFQSNISMLHIPEAAVDQHLNKISFMRFKIALLINPQERYHSDLMDVVTNLVGQTRDPGETATRAKLQEALTSIAQKVLKGEWERVKRGD